jgi:rhodanese-related sulfurtransferase
MTVRTVDAATLKAWADRGEVVLVDVREPAEHAAERIPGSVLLPLSKINRKELPATPGKKLVLHCRAGRRGETACRKLLAEDPGLEVYNFEGGIEAWARAGHALEKSGRYILPLDRQVQLTVGLLVLVGTLLGYFVNPDFLLMTGFFGAGLVFAGVSGFCGMALLLAKMPWNSRIAPQPRCHITTTRQEKA